MAHRFGNFWPIPWAFNFLFNNFICWRAPFGYLYFPNFQMNQNWVHQSFLAWFWHYFHLVYWMRQDLNRQHINYQLNSLTTRPDWRPEPLTLLVKSNGDFFAWRKFLVKTAPDKLQTSNTSTGISGPNKTGMAFSF